MSTPVRAHCTSTRKRKTIKTSNIAARIASSWGSRTSDYAVPMNPATYRQQRDNLIVNGNEILVANKGARMAFILGQRNVTLAHVILAIIASAFLIVHLIFSVIAPSSFTHSSTFPTNQNANLYLHTSNYQDPPTTTYWLESSTLLTTTPYATWYFVIIFLGLFILWSIWVIYSGWIALGTLCKDESDYDGSEQGVGGGGGGESNYSTVDARIRYKDAEGEFTEYEDKYLQDDTPYFYESLLGGVNKFTWIYFAFASPVIIWVIAAVIGVTDIFFIVLLAVVSIVISLMYLLHEWNNSEYTQAVEGDDTNSVVAINWWSLALGIFLLMIVWILLWAFFGLAVNNSTPALHWSVWAVAIGSGIIAFLIPIGMAVHSIYTVRDIKDTESPDFVAVSIERNGMYELFKTVVMGLYVVYLSIILFTAIFI